MNKEQRQKRARSILVQSLLERIEDLEKIIENMGEATNTCTAFALNRSCKDCRCEGKNLNG